MNKLTILAAGLACTLAISSCEDYLNIAPKGKRIPTTLEDFAVTLNYDSYSAWYPIEQANLLLNDEYLQDMYAQYYPMYVINYNWDESGDRIYYNDDENTYNSCYRGIATANLVIEYAPDATEATDEEKARVIATARIMRDNHFFTVANYYADTYDPTTASEKLCVPLITSANTNAPYTQVTIQEMYDFLVEDLTAALDCPYLNDKGDGPFQPGRGAAYALLARVYLQMMDYEHALENAEKALAIKDDLIDWNAYYEENYDLINDSTAFRQFTSPLGFDCIENYCFGHGLVSSRTSVVQTSIERAVKFEEGDTHFLSSWRLRTLGTETYYYPMQTGNINYGGLRTVEQYYIKAECLARLGRVSEAMDVLNQVRKTRVLPEVYQPLTATTEEEAIPLIRQAKNNDLIMSIVVFADTRRYNAEGKYPITLTKVVNGETRTLKPDSRMWTFPFPNKAMTVTGNGTLVQNVER